MIEGRFPGDDVFAKLKSSRHSKGVRSLPRFSALDMRGRSPKITALIVVVFVGLLLYGLPKIGANSSATSLGGKLLSTTTTQGLQSVASATTNPPANPTTTGIDFAPTTLAPLGSGAGTSSSVIKTASSASLSFPSKSFSTTTTLSSLGNAANQSVTVRVANGTSVPGLATSITAKLANLNFNVVVPINATVSNLTKTTIYYYNGFQVAGQAIARVLGLSITSAVPYSTQAPLPDVYPSDVNVVLGTDVSG